MDTVPEAQRNIPVKGEYDVAVVGGGIAGIASALAAVRTGARKVILIEKQYALGGLATLGMIAVYLPLCDGMGNQVSYGISEELLRLSIKHGSEDNLPHAWLNNLSKEEKLKRRYLVQYNPYVFAILCEQLLIEEKVDVLYGTQVCSVSLSGSKIDALVCEGKSERFAIKVKSVVDASGDADVCRLAGDNIVEYAKGNTLASWYYSLVDDKIRLNMLGLVDNTNKDSEQSPQTIYTSLDTKELSAMTIASHSALLDHFLKRGQVSNTNSLSSFEVIPQVRMTRRIDGAYTLDDTEGVYFEDSIGMIGNWRKKGPIYEIPYRSLYSKKIKNLIAAGRCISATDGMWDITRVIPACAVTGEAAGTAAALTDDFSLLDVKRFQHELTLKGVVLRQSEAF